MIWWKKGRKTHKHYPKEQWHTMYVLLFHAHRKGIWTIIILIVLRCSLQSLYRYRLLSWLSNSKIWVSRASSQAQCSGCAPSLPRPWRLCGCKWCQLFWQSHRSGKAQCISLIIAKKKHLYVYTFFFLKGTKKRKLRPIAWIHTHIKLCSKMCVCAHLKKNETSPWDGNLGKWSKP